MIILKPSCMQPSGVAGRALVRAAIIAVLVSSAPGARAGADVLLKDSAIGGTLLSWGVAAWNGAPVGNCLAAPQPWGARVQAGHDNELNFVSLGAVRRACDLTRAMGWQLDLAPVAAVGHWSARSDAAGAHGAWDIAFVPMMRWSQPLGADLRADLEFGIGPAWLSEPDIGNRRKSTNFQFSDHAGLGLGSADGHWRVSLAYRHVSNADIRTPNNAVDFKGLSLEWRP